jgi:mono/diheme cytochrome c family protein
MLSEMCGKSGIAVAAFCASIVAAAPGCSEPATASCMIPQGPTCPDPAPSYATDVSPIFQTYCVRCHGPGGVESNKPLTSWAEVNSRYGSVLQQVFYFCAMPPATEPQLTDPAARAALLGWLECMAPNN